MPPGYTLASSNTRKAYKMIGSLNYSDAQTACKADKSWLAMPKSSDDMADIYQICMTQNKTLVILKKRINSLIVATVGWIGIMKNENVNLGSNAASAADAEKYLEYYDGTPYTAIGGVSILANENNAMCFILYDIYGSNWHDNPCSDEYWVICEFNCENVNYN